MVREFISYRDAMNGLVHLAADYGKHGNPEALNVMETIIFGLPKAIDEGLIDKLEITDCRKCKYMDTDEEGYYICRKSGTPIPNGYYCTDEDPKEEYRP